MHNLGKPFYVPSLKTTPLHVRFRMGSVELPSVTVETLLGSVYGKNKPGWSRLLETGAETAPGQAQAGCAQRALYPAPGI